ncbi:MAG: flagellar basal body rod protein FlgB [Verrucomicrobiota bacterium]
MTEALFGGVNYQAAKKGLDACVERQRALAANIANLETPGYRRLEVPHAFQQSLRDAVRRQDGDSIAALRPRASVDTMATPKSPDGNTVNLTDELMAIQENGLEHGLHVQLINGRMSRLRAAISGRMS